MHVEFPENLGRVEQVLILEDPIGSKASVLVLPYLSPQVFMICGHVLLSIVSDKRQVEDQSYPVPIDQEEEGQESVDGSFGDDVGVQAVAEIDRIDVVTVSIERLALRTEGKA